MRTEEEILDRIEAIKICQQMNKDEGYISIQSVRDILINNLKWVLSESNEKVNY